MARSLLRKLRVFFGGRWLRVFALLSLLFLAVFLLFLDNTIREAFEGRRFALPARVYARPLELYPGVKLSESEFTAELKRLGYKDVPEPQESGTFRRILDGFDLVSRAFDFWDGKQPAMFLRVAFKDNVIATLEDSKSGSSVTLTRLEPPLIGGIYPGHNEDRALVKLEGVPKILIDALISVEDRKFYSHWGIDPRGIARAIVATLSGRGVQGGSTITQQLVKNFFLTSERTLQRKFTEILMAVLLELHYEKSEILETYINEIYLGQDGNRAIHGFGFSSTR